MSGFEFEFGIRRLGLKEFEFGLIRILRIYVLRLLRFSWLLKNFREVLFWY